MEFHEAYTDEDSWNTKSFTWPHNPTWGDIWVVNMRSKDDVCAITRATTFLHYAAADAEDEAVRAACTETLETMKNFNKDIVDSGYYIRTKDADGAVRLVTDQDLGNYIQYAELDERNECTARLATDLIAYGEPRTNDCGSGFGSLFESFAVQTHYYNYPIVWDYHLAALGNALVHGHADVALALLEGVTARMDAYMDPESEEPGADHHDWGKDMAVLLVKSASVGLPLTGDDARHIQRHWDKAVDELRDWPRWDLWDESVPDGDYPSHDGFRPATSDEAVRVESLGMFLELCNSPFQNPEGARVIDCEIVKDPSRWGE
jgi:hypothetical protein